MAQWLKRGQAADVKAAADKQVRDIVEATLADIEARGDAAVLDHPFRHCYRPANLVPSKSTQTQHRHWVSVWFQMLGHL